MINANELFRDFTGTEHYYQYLLGMVYTDGIKALCEQFECYWLLDIICSYQPQLREEEFQVWSLGVNEDDSAIVICTDGNNTFSRHRRYHLQTSKQRKRQSGLKVLQFYYQANTDQMQVLNPFNKKGREDSSLFDRFGIAAIGIIIIGATILLPIIIYKWYQTANQTKRLLFWLLFFLLLILGALKEQYIYG